MAAPREPEGMYIGPWRLVCELGKGGMAQVIQVVRDFPDGGSKTAALKIPRLAAVADRRALEQFETECKIALMMEHDHLIRAFDRGVHKGVPYLVLDFIAGKNLSQINGRMAKAGLTWSFDAVAHVGRAVGSALRYIHGFGPGGRTMNLVHRDVSAKNVIVSGDGGVFVSDFGIASADVVHTDGSMFKGTWQYVPPEQVGGEIGPWCDAFGLGTLLWEMIELSRFRGGLDDKAVRQAAVEGRVPELRRQGVPPVLLKVVKGLLDPDWRSRMTIAEAMDLLPRVSVRDELGGNTQRLFGAVVTRTGHTRLDFEVPAELLRTMAIAEAAAGGPSDGTAPGEGDSEVRSVDEVRAAGASTADFGPKRMVRPPPQLEPAPAAATVAERRDEPALARVATARLQERERRASVPPGPTAFVAEPVKTRVEVAPASLERRTTHPDVDDGSVHDDVAVDVPITHSAAGSMGSTPGVSRGRLVTAIAAGIVMVLGAASGVGHLLTSLPREARAVEAESTVSAVSAPDSVEPEPVAVVEPELEPVFPEPEPVAAVRVDEPARAVVVAEPASEATIAVTPTAPAAVTPEDPIAVARSTSPTEPAPTPAAAPTPRPKAPAPKATARLRLLTKQAEVRIGQRTIAMSSTGTHSLDLSIASGKQKLRWRLTAADPWQTVPVTFAPREQVTIFVERNGPRVSRPEQTP